MNCGKTKGCWRRFTRSEEGLNIWTKLLKAREVEVGSEEEIGIEVDAEDALPEVEKVWRCEQNY